MFSVYRKNKGIGLTVPIVTVHVISYQGNHTAILAYMHNILGGGGFVGTVSRGLHTGFTLPF